MVKYQQFHITQPNEQLIYSQYFTFLKYSNRSLSVKTVPVVKIIWHVYLLKNIIWNVNRKVRKIRMNISFITGL